MRKFKLLFSILCGLAFPPIFSNAQNTPAPPDASFKIPIIQPSPDAASLGRYGEYPVSLNNGLVNISVPLYEIKTGKLSLPISLSYHAAGVKAYDIASSVGLGWSLNAGSSVTRAIMGKPDEGTTGFLNKPFPNPSSPGEHFPCFVSFLARPFAAFDGQADKFYYNMGGSSGMFLFKNIKATGTPWEIVTIPYSPIKITVSPDFHTITIIDLDGTTYVFGQPEITTVNADGSFYSEGPTAWFLTSIISADKSDTITLTYTTPVQFRTVQFSNSLTERDDYMYSLTGRISQSQSATVNVTNTVKINEIIFNNGKVSFEYGNRDDVIENGIPGKKLTAIKIFQNTNGQYSQIKQFNFNQSYFTAAPGQLSQVQDLGFIFDKRLRLDNVYEQGFLNGSPAAAKPPYSFEYEAGDFPLYGTTAQDLMGFYNGKHNNKNLLFYGIGNTDSGPVLGLEYGADRTTNPSAIKAGSLKKITFPTGGYTEFETEPNKVTYSQTESVETYDSYPYWLISHDLATHEISFTVTPDKTGGANSVTAQFKVNLINNLTGPKISTTVQLFDETTQTDPTFDDSNTIALFDLPSTYDNFNQTRDVTLLLNHTYKLSYDNHNLPAETANFVFTEVSWKIFTGYSTVQSQKTDYNGGLRIKSIKSDDGSGNVVKKNYAYTKWYYNSNLFKGNVATMANFFKTRTRRFWNSSTQDPTQGEYKWYNSYGENPTFQIGSSSNSVVSYEEVEEYSVDSDNNPLGKTVYTFNKAEDGIPSIAPFFRTDQEWKRSQLAKEQIYKSAPGGKFVLLKEIKNEYDYTQMEAIKSYYASLEQDFTGPVSEPNLKECSETLSRNVYKWMDLDQYVFKSNLISSTTVQYDENGLNPQSTKTEYVYDEAKHKQLIRTTQETSKSEILVTDLKYPLDYTIGSCDLQTCLSTFNETINDLLIQKNDCELQYYDQYNSYVIQAANIAGPIFQAYQACDDGCNGWLECYANCYNDYQDALGDSQYDETLSLADAAFNNYLNCNSTYQTSVTQNAVPQLNSCKFNYSTCIDGILSGSAPANDKAIVMMQRDNVVNRIVENTSGLLLNGIEYITDGIKTDFKPIANGAVGQDVVWKFASSDLVTKASFDQTPANYYKPVGHYLQYDNSNNIIEKAREHDISSSYIWDYNVQYPVAEVTNAKPEDIAYTSFEADGSGNFSIGSSTRNTADARTGKQSYNLVNGDISKSGLVSGTKYSISFWAQSGTIYLNGVVLTPTSVPIVNGWQYYDSSITGSGGVTIATLSGSAIIDELRLLPSDARMTTYTFDPVVGMTSATDVNNHTTYYEYDALKRLSLVRDDQRNIIKRISYHYQLD